MANLYVSSAGENAIKAFDATTGASTKDFVVAGSSPLSSPQGLVWGSDGKLYVSSAGTSNVLRYNPDGSFDTVFATANGLNTPEGLTFDSSGNLYVSNYNPVQGQNGNVLRWLANATFDKIFAADPNLTIPWGLTFGPDGNLYVCNGQQGLAKVLRFTSTGAFDGVFAQEKLLSTGSLVFDSIGNLYVTDTINNLVNRYYSSGAFAEVFATAGGLSQPNGIVIGSDGNLYVTSRIPPAIQGAPFPGSSVLRYLGYFGASAGAFDKVFASGRGLDNPTWLTFGP